VKFISFLRVQFISIMLVQISFYVDFVSFAWNAFSFLFVQFHFIVGYMESLKFHFIFISGISFSFYSPLKFHTIFISKFLIHFIFILITFSLIKFHFAWFLNFNLICIREVLLLSFWLLYLFRLSRWAGWFSSLIGFNFFYKWKAN